jgi:hypothetical protein
MILTHTKDVCEKLDLIHQILEEKNKIQITKISQQVPAGSQNTERLFF